MARRSTYHSKLPALLRVAKDGQPRGGLEPQEVYELGLAMRRAINLADALQRRYYGQRMTTTERTNLVAEIRRAEEVALEAVVKYTGRWPE